MKKKMLLTELISKLNATPDSNLNYISSAKEIKDLGFKNLMGEIILEDQKRKVDFTSKLK